VNLPDREEALRLMREAGCSQAVIDHCLSVTRLALELTASIRKHGVIVDRDLVEAGAILHDIGRSWTHGVEHGAVGGEIARQRGMPEPLARIIERHVGAGITDDEADRIGLKRGSYVPETLEEKIVAYADKLIEGNRRVDIEVTVEKMAEILGRDHPALDRLRALHDEMVGLMGVEV
jgi:uncharacterized protein